MLNLCDYIFKHLTFAAEALVVSFSQHPTLHLPPDTSTPPKKLGELYLPHASSAQSSLLRVGENRFGALDRLFLPPNFAFLPLKA